MVINTVTSNVHRSSAKHITVIEDLIKYGYAVLKNPPVNAELLKTVYQLWQDYFSSTVDYNDSGLKKPSGYYNYWREDITFKSIGIPKESFYFNQATQLPHNQALQEYTSALYNQLSDLSRELLDCLSNALTKYSKKSLQSLSGYEDSLRIIHSPPILDPTNRLQNQKILIRNREHEDIDILTLLPSATVAGLQFLTNEEWRTVDYEFGDIIVNTGDAFNLISNGIVKSATHRVICLDENAAMKPRFSMAFFLAIK